MSSICDFRFSVVIVLATSVTGIFRNQAFKKEISSRNVNGKLLFYAFQFINLMTSVIVCL